MSKIVVALVAIALSACATAPDMSRREARDITDLAVVMEPRQ
ncbi:hypothetical protein [Mesorhizobium sp. M0968]